MVAMEAVMAAVDSISLTYDYIGKIQNLQGPALPERSRGLPGETPASLSSGRFGGVS
jgi:hypothetical protein